MDEYRYWLDSLGCRDYNVYGRVRRNEQRNAQRIIPTLWRLYASAAPDDDAAVETGVQAELKTAPAAADQ